MLRGRDPAAFTCLTTTPVTFAYSDAAAVLRATSPMIGLDPRGRIRQIRLNGRSLAPVRLPAAQARAFYAAYRAFAELAADPEALVTTTLAPGDCVIFDNTRVLHGRTAFADGGGTASAAAGIFRAVTPTWTGWHRRWPCWPAARRAKDDGRTSGRQAVTATTPSR